MKSIVIAYEDHYCDELHRLIKRLRRDAGLPACVLEARSVHGTGGFINEVPKLLRMPLPQTRLPPDRVVCFGDADRPRNLVPEGPAAIVGADRTALDSALLDFEARWRRHLAVVIPPASLDRLRVICLRWNKESLFVASPDALLDYARKHERFAEVDRLLGQCVPAPRTLAADDFTVQYRGPVACMDSIFRVIEGRNYKKGRDDEDLLRDQVAMDGDRRARLLERCPDLRRLLAELQ